MNAKVYADRFARYTDEGEDYDTADQWARDDATCNGHESLAGEYFGEAVFCDGSCQR